MKNFCKYLKVATWHNLSGFTGLLAVVFMMAGNVLIAQVGVHTDFPDASAAMEIQSTDKGLLIPRVELTGSLTNPSPVTSPAVGLMVFNTGLSQELGFYYWDGFQWVLVGSGSAAGEFWSLYGNEGTIAGDNFIGTTDAQDFAIFTNNSERMRVEQDGQVVIGSSASLYDSDLLTVVGNSTQNSAINAYSPGTGLYSEGGVYGMISMVNTSVGYSVFARNSSTAGYGSMFTGSNLDPYILNNRSAGLASTGNDGIFAYGGHSTGTGIIAVGSTGDTAFTVTEGSGGAFTGYHGSFSKARHTSGTGVIGGGNYTETYILSEGSGGAFTGTSKGVAAWGTGVSSFGGWFNGYHGSYNKATNTGGVGVIGLGSNLPAVSALAGAGAAFIGQHGLISKAVNSSNGTGVVGIGNNNNTVYMISAGSGAAFNGYHGLLGVGTNATEGNGVVGSGNGVGWSLLTTGVGGSFTGYHGSFGKGINIAGGTGVIGLGNNLSMYNVYDDGSGGAFTGIQAGTVGWGTNSTSGIGVIGAGNNLVPTTPSNGTGGAFTGYDIGVCGYSTNTSTASGTLRAGGYFETADGRYAYVGVYNAASQNNRKIIGSAGVSTIVKNKKGELITLTCPEAPEELFMDFGIGQLVNGRTHITIDPDLAININVSEDHPLKVFVTPEGECNGLYVTNKSGSGFDVVELHGGSSNIPFSWQIVATRADEEIVRKDGTVDISICSARFPPAPGPLESYSKPNQSFTTINEMRTEKVQEISETSEVKTINLRSEIIDKDAGQSIIRK